jgi:spore germination protein KC
VIYSFSLTACVGKEPNEIAYIVALGIDSCDNGNYKITIQYANTTQISGGASEEGGKIGNQIVENIAVEAPNIYAAIGLANNIVSKTFSLSHAKLIVFSQEVAKNGLKDIVETFIRSEEVRPDVYLAVAVDDAGKYLKSVNPAMEVNPATYYQMIYDKNTLIGIPDGVAKNFFSSLETKDYDCLLPIAGIIDGEESSSESDSQSNQESSESSESSEKSSQSSEESDTENEKQKDAPLNEGKFEYKIKSYIGGETAIEQKNKSEAMGSAIFENDKMVGILGSIDTEIFKMLIGDYKYTYLTIYNEKTPDNPVTVKVIKKKRPKYDVDIENKKVTVNLFLEGDVYSLPADYNIEKDIENFEKNSSEYIADACKNFMKEFSEKYTSDIFRLKEKSKIHFLTNDKYESYKKEVNFGEYDMDVKVNFKIRRTGLVIREEK